MMTSLTSDDEWLFRFRNTPAWQPASVPALVLAPHPDDETLGAGGLIASLRQRGVPVTVIAATDGENSYDTVLEERKRLGRVREAEQQAALALLGVPAENIVRLRLTDSGLHEEEHELTQRLLETAKPGMQLIAPWRNDFHPDHEACARAAAAVAEQKGLTLISYFFWTWHRGHPQLLDAEPVVRFVPDRAALQARSEALQCHRSQLEHDRFAPILPQELRGPTLWPFEIFLPAADAA